MNSVFLSWLTTTVFRGGFNLDRRPLGGVTYQGWTLDAFGFSQSRMGQGSVLIGEPSQGSSIKIGPWLKLEITPTYGLLGSSIFRLLTTCVVLSEKNQHVQSFLFVWILLPAARHTTSLVFAWQALLPVREGSSSRRMYQDHTVCPRI